MRSAHRRPMVTLARHATVLLFVVLWTLPTLGLLVSSVRDSDSLSTSGWWTALAAAERNAAYRTPASDAQMRSASGFTIEERIFDEHEGVLDTWGTRLTDLAMHQAGEAVTLDDGSRMTLTEDGLFRWESDQAFRHSSGIRVFYVYQVSPTFTLDNYREVLSSEGMGRAFLNTLTVTVPATFIPILIAAFAAYALAWMNFAGRLWLLAGIVGLLVVPLQISLIPVLRMYAGLAGVFGWEAKSYGGVWLAHTGFGLPLAIYLLRNYMAGLPREVIESARMDGASHFVVFRSIVLPLSVPALASFAIFQFLWVWNDLLVALIFLGQGEDRTVMTAQLVELLGSRGDNWEILTSGAFISMLVPLIVFVALQRHFVRGLLAGSVK